MREYLKAFFRAVADFFATMAAKYKIYVERENAKLRAAAKANAAAMAQQAMLAEYTAVAEIVATANNNLVAAGHDVLRRVDDFSQIANPYAPCAFYERNGYAAWSWTYRLHRSRGSSMPVDAVRRMLQSELDAVCATYGFPPLFVDAVFRQDGVVGIWVMPQASLAGGAHL